MFARAEWGGCLSEDDAAPTVDRQQKRTTHPNERLSSPHCRLWPTLETTPGLPVSPIATAKEDVEQYDTVVKSY